MKNKPAPAPTLSITDLLKAIVLQVTTPILNELRKVEQKMSQISDLAGTMSTGLQAVSQQLTTLGTDLTAKINALEAKIAAGSVTQADLDALKAVNDQITAMGSTITTLDQTVQAAAQ